MLLIINIAAFQAGWLLSVIGGAQQMPWLGPLVVALALAFHLRAARQPIEEFVLIAICALLGAAFDSVLVAAGWVTYKSGLVSDNLAPYWIVTMWMLFATTLNVAFRWLQDKLVLAAVLGAISGPLSYYAGGKIGAIVFNDFTAAMIGLGIAWAILLPLLLVIARQFDGTVAGSGEAAALSRA